MYTSVNRETESSHFSLEAAPLIRFIHLRKANDRIIVKHEGRIRYSKPMK